MNRRKFIEMLVGSASAAFVKVDAKARVAGEKGIEEFDVGRWGFECGGKKFVLDVRLIKDFRDLEDLNGFFARLIEFDGGDLKMKNLVSPYFDMKDRRQMRESLKALERLAKWEMKCAGEPRLKGKYKLSEKGGDGYEKCFFPVVVPNHNWVPVEEPEVVMNDLVVAEFDGRAGIGKMSIDG